MIFKIYINPTFKKSILFLMVISCLPFYGLSSTFTFASLNASCQLSVEVGINNIPECGASDGSVSLMVSGGTGDITYSWGPDATRDDLVPGSYCIVVQDEAGCSVLVDFTLGAMDCPTICSNFSASAVIEKLPSCGNANGVVSLSFLGANEPVAISWGADIRRTDLMAGNYSVTLVDAAGCTEQVDFVLIEAPCKCEDFAATVVIEQLPKCDQSNGIARIDVQGANGQISYSWGEDSRMENLAAGGYWVTVTDEEGCSAVVDFNLGNTPCDCQFTAQAIVEKNPSCTRNDGAVRLTFSNAIGPVRHSLGTADQYTNLSPGTYNILVSDSICSVIVTFTLPEPDPEFCQSICDLAVSANIINQPSCTRRDGAVCIEVSGAMGEVSYSWGPQSCYDNLSPGFYTVIVTDEVCTDTITFELKEPNPDICDQCTLSATAVINQQPSCTGQDGSVSIIVAGATGNVTYDWGPLSRYDNLNPGVYSVLVTDEVCTYRVNFILSPPTDCPTVCTLNAMAFIKAQPSCEKSDGMACIQVSGAQGPVTYNWGAENCRNNLAAGVYIVIVSDTVCSDTISFTLEERAETCPCPLKGKLSIRQIPNCENDFGVACIDVIGATGTVTYSWGPDNCREDLTPGSYMVILTDEETPPCTDTLRFSIPEKPLTCCTLEASIDSLRQPSCDSKDGFVAIGIKGQNNPVTYEWSDIPESVSTRMDLDTGEYQVIVIETDTDCRDTVNFRLEKQSLNFTAEVSDSCSADGAISVMVEGGNENHTFIWSDGTLGSDRSNLSDGEYTVTVTNNLTNCLASDAYEITAKGPNVDLIRNKKVCLGDTTSLELINKDTSQKITFEWFPGDGIDILNPTVMKPSFISERVNTPFDVTVKVKNEAGCEVEKNVSIEYRNLEQPLDPKFVFAANCKDTRVTFKNESKNADLFFWDFGVDGIESDTSNKAKTTYAYEEAGTYLVTLKLTEAFECSKDLSEFTYQEEIEVGEPIELVADFEYDQNLPCEDELTVLFNNTSSVQFGTIDSLVWSFENTISNETSISQDINRGEPFSLTLEVFDETRLCNDTMTKVVNLDPVRFELVEIDACIEDSIQLTQSIEEALPASYCWAENDFFSTEDLNPVVVLTESEDFDLISKVANECLTFELTVNLDEKPSYSPSPDTSLCAEDQLVNIGVTTDEATSVKWAADPLFTDPLTVMNPFDAGIGNYYFQLKNGNCSVTDSIIITPKMLDISSFGDTLCGEGMATIGIINNNPLDILMVEWQNPESDDPNLTVPVTATSEFNVNVSNQFGCEASETVSVIVVDTTTFADNLSISLNPGELAAGQTGTLTAALAQNTGFEIVWNDHPTLQANNNTAEITPTECTTYSFRIIDNASSCFVTRDTVINPGCISGNLFFPNAFSPNGDDNNDELLVRGVTGLEEMKLIIYNRWGEKVFETIDPKIGWDGTFRGKRVTSDVYGYHLTVKCPSRAPEIIKGNVTVLR